MANFLFGVTGSISIYKTLDVLSNLKKSKENCSVIMTPMAKKFVTELTFSTFTEGRTYSEWGNSNPMLHIDLAKWADTFIIAPASANTISAIANGLGNNLLLSTVLAYDKKIFFVPAMNTNMYENVFIKNNIEKLKKAGHVVIEPDSGVLACGDVGKGRYPNTQLLFDYINDIYKDRKSLTGKKILISAGPTKEDIDPVRYITNRSSGKMGYSLTLEAVKRSGDVTLVSGETNLLPPIGIKKYIKVRNSEEFFSKIKNVYENYDIIIMAAAISDFTPENKAKNKIKKDRSNLEVKLKRTKDVLEYLGKNKKEHQILVGFAAETQNIIENATRKLNKKNLDFIVANDVSKHKIGFQSDLNAAIILTKNGTKKEIDMCNKKELARRIFDFILEG